MRRKTIVIKNLLNLTWELNLNHRDHDYRQTREQSYPGGH